MCTAFVVGNVIGVGIFVLPASLAPYGLSALTGWLITVAGCAFLAISLSNLARAFPDDVPLLWVICLGLWVLLTHPAAYTQVGRVLIGEHTFRPAALLEEVLDRCKDDRILGLQRKSLSRIE